MTTIYNPYKTDRERELILVFARLDEWFDKPEELLDFRIAPGISDAREILAEILMLNRHVLQAGEYSGDQKGHSLAVGTTDERRDCGDQKRCFQNPNNREHSVFGEGESAWIALRYQLRDQLSDCLQYMELPVHPEQDEIPQRIGYKNTVNLIVHHAQRQLLHLETLQESFCSGRGALPAKNLRTLYRPVGERELELIIASGMTSFPPRLFWQPMFYPVLGFAYAAEIAERWNMGEPDSDGAGFVMSFEIPEEYFRRYDVHTGGHWCDELNVPAEQLDDFNAHINNGIRLEKAFLGARFYPSESVQRILEDQFTLSDVSDGQ